MIDQQKLWDEQPARSYDTPGEGMFAPEVLGPTVETLRRLADGGKAVEFAIGTGRVAIPLRDAGVPVRGIELSQAMLSRLREKVDAQRIPVVQGDMTEAFAGGGNRLVYLVFNTIGNLLTQEAQIACFRNAARHLSPGGCFVIELWVPQLRALAPGHRGTVEAAEEGYLLVDTIDLLTQRLVSHHVRFDPRIDGSREARVSRTPHRYIWPSELDLMARLAGMELEHRWADWSGSPFTGESTGHVSVYRLTAPMRRSCVAHSTAESRCIAPCRSRSGSAIACTGAPAPRRSPIGRAPAGRGPAGLGHDGLRAPGRFPGPAVSGVRRRVQRPDRPVSGRPSPRGRCSRRR